MNRSQFLSLFAIPFLPKVDLPETKPAFNVKKIQERIDFIRKYPLTEKECRSSEEALKLYSESGILVWTRNRTEVKWIATQL